MDEMKVINKRRKIHTKVDINARVLNNMVIDRVEEMIDNIREIIHHQLSELESHDLRMKLENSRQSLLDEMNTLTNLIVKSNKEKSQYEESY